MPPKDRIAGYDCLRVLGLVFVVTDHILSVLDKIELTQFHKIEMGVVGVTLFLAVSGALVTKDRKAPQDWIVGRLSKIYPSFWIATTLGFILAGVTGYKEVSWLKFFWQMSGLGLGFVEDIINVATWFITLLLSLYFYVFLARRTRHETLLIAALASTSIILVTLKIDPLYYSRCLTFACAMLLFRDGQGLRYLGLFITIFFACSLYQREMFYPAFGLGAVWLSRCVHTAPGWITFLAKYSYEIFLCHGIFLVGFMKVFAFSPPLAILTGLFGTLASSMILQHLIVKLSSKTRSMKTDGE